MRDLEAMKTALRVLTAIVEKRPPEPADVEDLGKLASPLSTSSLEEIAREVVQLALRDRASVRACSAGASMRASAGSAGQGS